MSTAGKYKAGTAVITLRLSDELKEQVRRGAEARSMSMTTFLRLAIREMVSSPPPTPSDLPTGDDDLGRYIMEIQRSAKVHDRAIARRRVDALAIAHSIADMLTERFGIQSVRVVGSMGRPGAQITETSDIDLLVTGLRREDYVSALSAAEQVARGQFAVDLIRREDLTDEAFAVFFCEGDDTPR